MTLFSLDQNISPPPSKSTLSPHYQNHPVEAQEERLVSSPAPRDNNGDKIPLHFGRDDVGTSIESPTYVIHLDGLLSLCVAPFLYPFPSGGVATLV